MSDLVKKCMKCGRKKKLADYYCNAKWQNEMYRDRWCKACAKRLIVDEENLKLYFEDNRRVYPKNFWGRTYTKVKNQIKKESPNLIGVARENLTIDTTRNNIFKVMNFRGHYKFIEDKMLDKDNDEYYEADVREDERVKKYNDKWHGYYTDKDLKYLEEYYKGLDDDFRLSNQSYRDYAKKVCKASLAMDNAFSEMQQGVVDADKRYKELKNIFDSLSQSAKFAEKSRNMNDVVGFGSLGELTAHLENKGFLTTPVKFPDDDIDIIIDDFRWLIASVGEKF